jgi:SAM-dependent methyltransferase
VTEDPKAASEPCRICGSATLPLGAKRGKFKLQEFYVRHCDGCGYSFVANPWLDYGAIYSEEYYTGKGADPMVDYLYELENPQASVRRYEWQGILDWVRQAVSLRPETRWIDFGCGNGGLVRYCRNNTSCPVVGFEEGWIKERAESRGVPYLSRAEMEAARGTFDIVTAIEVLEHVPDPLATLREIRSLLKPGGYFFLTTGNAEVFRRNLLEWSYLTPEIHISLFEPRTLARALELTGFRPEFRGFSGGHTDIIRFKILKNIGCRKIAGWERILPWSLLSRLADLRFRISAHPSGIAV